MLKSAELAEKLSPVGLPMLVLFMVLSLTTARSLSIDLNFKELVKIAEELDEDDQHAIFEDRNE